MSDSEPNAFYHKKARVKIAATPNIKPLSIKTKKHQTATYQNKTRQNIKPLQETIIVHTYFKQAPIMAQKERTKRAPKKQQKGKNKGGPNITPVVDYNSTGPVKKRLL